MNNLLCLISRGRWGSPKVEVGQQWFSDYGNPFDESVVKVTYVGNGFVKFVYVNSNIPNVEFLEQIYSFRWTRTLIVE